MINQKFLVRGGKIGRFTPSILAPVKLLLLSFMIVGSLSACTPDKGNNSTQESQKAEKNQQDEHNGEDKRLINFDQENDKRLEQGILLYGESAKGGYYITTINSAYSNIKNTGDSTNSVVVNVTVKNIRGELVDLSELKFNLKDEKAKKSFEGKVLPDNNSSDMHVKPNELKTLNVSFEVPNIAEEYMFYIQSSLDPIPVHWKIDNLNQRSS